MENASKALLMAASVLLGMMIVSVAVALFNSFGGSSREIMNEIERGKIAEFNTQFLKYYGENYNTDTGEIEKIKITSHDIVTLTNLAKKNNIEYEVQEQNGKSDNSYYIQIDVKNTKNLEKLNEEKLIAFLQENSYKENTESETKYYYIENIETSTITGRVIYVKILEL